MVTRREFFKLGMAAAAGAVLSTGLPLSTLGAQASSQKVRSGMTLNRSGLESVTYSPDLRKFAQPLRGVGGNGIPLAAPDGTRQWGDITAQHYSMDIVQYQDTLHPNLGPTTLWGYNPSGNATPRHLGGLIVAQKGTPVQMTFSNHLPARHILPVDTSDSFMDARASQNRTCVHLHGGLVPWISDGGPMAWFGSSVTGPNYGPSATLPDGSNIYQILNPQLQPYQAEYYYPNKQSARMVWYHDHAHDVTRLNAYAGIASAYIIRDDFEAGLRAKGLPDFIENGGREIPIVVQDKVFVGANIDTTDPKWVQQGLPSTPGSLWYPHEYEPEYDDLGGKTPNPSCVPEMFGDTMLANGVVYPEAVVEARRYRLRILNACQARFLNLQMYVDDGSPDGITHIGGSFVPTNAKGPDWLVLGTEGGFLSKPALVPSNIHFNPNLFKGSLITAPAERWDVLVDFSGYAGKNIIVYNDAPAPFPFGDDEFDYFPANFRNPRRGQPGFGPNTRQIMRFRVVAATSSDDPLQITTDTDLTAGNDPSLVGKWSTSPLPLPAGVPVRKLTLNEEADYLGRLIQRLGTDTRPMGSSIYGRPYMMESTENPRAGSTEVWQIMNLTGDTHPIHFHLVNVQILSRRRFDGDNYRGKVNFTWPAYGPEAQELGWKETVRIHPNEIIWVLMRFDLPSVPFTVPMSPSTALGVQGHEYVWHCHILEHEEHDMMRPMVVIP